MMLSCRACVSGAGCPACVPRPGPRRARAQSTSTAGMIGRQGLWQEQALAFPFPCGGRRNHVKSRAGWLCPVLVRPCLLARLRGGQPMLAQIPLPDPSSELHAVVQDYPVSGGGTRAGGSAGASVSRWFRCLPPLSCARTLAVPAR
jgi:hypothetical protein